MRAARPAPLPLLTALAALAVAAALFAIYVYPAHAQEGSAPDKPRGLEAAATHGQVTLTWNDPEDESITGYVVLRRVRVNDTGGDFSELVANTETAATTYTDTTVAASLTYTYRIKAINEHGTSERSRWVHIDTPAPPEPAANSPATGAPAITGTAQVGETLTADTSGIADEDGTENATFSYQWLADGTAISGATASAYTAVEDDEGKAVAVQVDFTDDAGNDETLTSAPTDAVAAAEPTEPPAKPTDLSATATHNQVVLTWKDPNDDSITGYVILRRVPGVDPEGQFSELVPNTGTAATTYTDTTVAAETRYTYRIKAINQYGASERSRWYHIATPAAPEPPPNNPATGSLSITGTVQVGETLTVDTSGVGDEDGRENATFSYQWLADGTAISGATANAYTPVEADEGKAITVQVSFTDDAGNDEALTSEATDAVAAAPATPAANNPATGAPTIRGTAQVGEMLAADTSGMSDADGLSNVSFSYQWLADDVEIAGATGSTYTLADSDEGKTVKVRVSFTDDAANPESLTSAATVAVEARPNSPATGAPTISGTAEIGETLTAETSGIADADGLSNVQYEYQWLADDAEIAGATSLTYTLVSAEEGKVIKVRVSFADDAGNEETLTSVATDGVAAAGPSEPPAKPQGMSATATHDQAVLTWDDPGDDSITGYVVLRRIRVNDQGGEFSVLVPDTGSAAATYTDASVAAETPYTYRIKAINKHGTSERSRWYHIDTQAPPGAEPGPAGQAPANLTAVPADGQVVLSWDAPAEDADAVTGYQVLRAEGQGGLSTLVSDTGSTTTTYTDAKVADGYSYAYRVKAIRDGERSGASNEARVQLKPAKPTGLSAETVAYNTVTLTWDEPQDDSGTGYVVMRLDFVRSDMITLAADTGTADTGYTDETVEPETLYFYYVQAINPGGESELSDYAVARTPEAPDPALFAPSNLTVELVDGRVSLGWDAPAEDAGSVTGYEITRARGWDDPIVLVADTGSAATAHIDETADAPGETYAYRVKAVRNGERSQTSNEALIQLPDPPPSAPSGLAASLGSGGVSLVWNAPVEDAGTVTGYEVLRAQGGGALTTLAADTGDAATAYSDFSAGGVSESYAYRVRAIRGEQKSADSNEARVQLPPARPTGVVSASSSDLVLLSWADPQDDSVTGYRILRRREVADVAADFATLAEDTGTAETSYADDTVENGRVYVYRVLAIGPGGVSEPSRDVRVRTTVPVPPPDRPRGLPSQGTPQPRQSVSEPAGEDCSADRDTTCRVAVGGSVTGNIANNTDIDSFAVYLEAGHQYQIDLEGDDTSQGTLADPNIGGVYEIRGDGTYQSVGIPGETQDSDSGEGKNARLTFTSSATKTYYILAQGRPGQNVTGTYRLSVTAEKAGSGYGRFMPLEGRLQLGGTLSGTLGVPTNYGIFSYYFAMEGLEVGRYTVGFGTGGIDSIHHFLTDRERSGTVTLEDTWIIVDQAHGRRSFTFDVRPGMEGNYYVLLVMRRGNPADYTATLEEAMPHLRVGRTGVVGEVPADSDGFALHMEFFSVDLRSGKTYQVDIKGKHSDDEECEDDDGNDEACTLDHTMLGNIQAPNGDYVGGDGNFDDTDDDIGGTVLHVYGGGGDRGNTRFTFTADQDGTHFLKVGGRLFITEDGSGFRAGTFRLSVREVN